MFIDGLAYVNIAKNLSVGIGTVWQPLVDRGGQIFYDHPPLVFWLESLYFRVFGNHLFTEDLYNLTVLTLVVLLMNGIWRQCTEARYHAYFAFPFLLFALSQENQLRYAGNMLECTLTLFALAGTYGLLRWRTRPMTAAFLCGLAAALAFLTKGPTGLFPLVAPALYYLTVERKWNWLATVVPAFTFAGLLGVLFLLEPAALSFFFHYFDQQVIAALTGRRIENIAGSRFAIVRSLVYLNVPQIVLCLLLFVYLRRRQLTSVTKTKRYGYFLVAVALTAFLPLLISIKQAAYYQLPSLPFFYLGLSLLLLPALTVLAGWLYETRWLRITGNTLLLAGVLAGMIFVAYSAGTTDRRDTHNIAVAKAIAGKLGKAEFYNLRIYGSRKDFTDSYAHSVPAFLNRNYDIFYDATDRAAYTLHLSTDTTAIPPQPGRPLFRADRYLLVKTD